MFTNMKKTIKIKAGQYFSTDEWMIKEYGSWEDHGCPDDHVCAILQREMQNDPMTFTIEEAEMLVDNLNYHIGGWDGFETPAQRAMFDRVLTGYQNRLKKALSKV